MKPIITILLTIGVLTMPIQASAQKRWANTIMIEVDGERIPKIALYTPSLRCWSKPGSDEAVCHFAMKQLGAVNSDPDILVHPDITMGAALSSMPTNARNALMDALTAKGFVTPNNASATSMRDFLNNLVGQIQPGVDVENGDVIDIE